MFALCLHFTTHPLKLIRLKDFKRQILQLALDKRWLAGGLAFGWAGVLLHAALWRTIDLPYMPALIAPFWLLASAIIAWVVGRGLLAREPLR